MLITTLIAAISFEQLQCQVIREWSGPTLYGLGHWCLIRCHSVVGGLTDQTCAFKAYCDLVDICRCDCQHNLKTGDRFVATCGCFNVPRRRAVEQNEPTTIELPHVDACMQNAVCNQMVMEYDSGFAGYSDTDTARSDHCNAYNGCTVEVFDLFTGAGNEIDQFCPACVDDYEYFDDGVDRTWDEAQALCESHDSDLATILTEEALECACGRVDGSPPLIGMRGNHEGKKRNYHMEYIDGSTCPVSKICVGEPFWLNGKPTKCKKGFLCVRLLPEFCKINNDITCNKTVTAVLCNRAGSRLARRRIVAQAGSELTISYRNDYDILNYGNNASILTIIAFAGIVLCIFVFGCYYCICKNKRKDITKQNQI